MSHGLSFLVVVALSFALAGCGPSGGKTAAAPGFSSTLSNVGIVPDTGGAYPGYFQVGAVADFASPLTNTGVMATIEVVSQPVNVNGGLLAFWVSDMLDNGIWGQVGWEVVGPGSTPQAFFYVFNTNLPSATLAQEEAAILTSQFAPVTDGAHTFSMSCKTGTVWSFEVDGQPIGTFDMGSSNSVGVNGCTAASEEYVGPTGTTPFTFTGPITFSGLEVLQSGTWSPVDFATSYGTGWGIQGALQGGTVASDSFVVGSAIQPVNDSTTLWAR